MMNRLDNCISSNRKAALSKEPKFDHIDLADKQKVCTHELQKLTRLGQLILLLCRWSRSALKQRHGLERENIIRTPCPSMQRLFFSLQISQHRSLRPLRHLHLRLTPKHRLKNRVRKKLMILKHRLQILWILINQRLRLDQVRISLSSPHGKLT